jgi:deoxyadenosine/deoxycytidine kinase
VFLKEPVEEWEKIVDKDGKTMLSKFYENQKAYSFPFQMMAYISRLSILREAVRKYKNEEVIIITERTLYTDKYVFAKMLYDQGKIEDVNYQIYLKWFEEFAVDFPVNKIIYVKADPTICHNRIHKRARVGEDVIPLAYLKECHDYHEDFLDETKGNISADKILLDGNIDIFENSDTLNEWINKIQQFIEI